MKEREEEHWHEDDGDGGRVEEQEGEDQIVGRVLRQEQTCQLTDQ